MKNYFYLSLIFGIILSFAATQSASAVSATTVELLYPKLTGAFIELQAEPLHPGLWTRIQWQDAFGGWHDIEGWQGSFNPDQRILWYVGEEQLGDGLFRWLVYENQGGNLLVVSASFNLPSRGGEVLHVELSLPTAVSVTGGGQTHKLEPVVETAVSKPIPGGLLGQYYNFNSQIPPTDPFQEANLVMTRVDETVDFFWPLGGQEAPDPSVHNDSFAIRWTGMVFAPVTGTYTFGTSHDDGVRLYVNDTLLYEDWQDGETREVRGSIALTGETWYPIRLEFWEHIWTAEIHLFWNYPGQGESIIQSAFLGTISPSSQASAASLEKTVTVDALAGWQSTGLQVEIGDLVEIEYLSGLWTSGGTHALHDANGTAQNYICSQVMPASECAEPVPDAVQGSLIARIGDTPPFFIGNKMTFNATSHGPLMLSMNDTIWAENLLDNVGSIVVRVAVTRPLVTAGEDGGYLYDNFDNPAYDGTFDSTLWTPRGDCEEVAQNDGVILFPSSCDLLVKPTLVTFDQLGLFEARVKVASDHTGEAATQEIIFSTDDLPDGPWWAFCGIIADSEGVKSFFNVVNVGLDEFDLHRTLPAEYDQWYTIRLEVNHDTMTFSCYVDDQLLGSVIPQDISLLKEAHFERILEAARAPGAFATTYADDVRLTNPSQTDETLSEVVLSPGISGIKNGTTWVVNPGNKHTYRLIECGSWLICESQAATQGAYLVTINGQLEQTWLLRTFGASQWFWIGLTDQDSEGDWQWSNGEAVTYTNWASGEPNDAWECGEDYAHMNMDWAPAGKWNDLGPCLPEWEFVTWAIIEKSP